MKKDTLILILVACFLIILLTKKNKITLTGQNPLPMSIGVAQ